MPSMNGDSLSAPLRKARPVRGKQYWRSLNELADKPEFHEFVEREFPAQASEWLGDGESRRTFMKVMGASMALAGLASCQRWPEEKLAPYAHRPANRMDGVPVHYATAFERGGMGQGIVAVSFDGRPIKVDGNIEHPLNQGASDIFLQGTVLDVYDPDRSRSPVERKGGKRTENSWSAFEAATKNLDVKSLVVLSEASRSPSVARLRRALVTAGAKWFEYEAISSDNQRAGAKLAFDRPLRAVPKLADAAIMVSLDADLFHGEPLSIKYSRDFAKGRQLRDSAKAAEATMNRLYVIESGFSITGAIADHRRGAKPSEIGAVTAALAAAVAGGNAEAAPKEIAELVAKIAADLNANKGKAVVVAGSRQPAEVHAAVAGINAAINGTVDYFAEPEDPRADADWTTHAQQLNAFVAAAAGAAHVLVIGANPVLTAPADLKIASVLGDKAIHLGVHEDETAQVCGWHLPQAHYLEAWGDVRTFDGTVSLAQPLIEPIFGAMSTIQVLSKLLGQTTDGYEIVRETAKADYLKGGFSEWAWKNALYKGVVAGTNRLPERPVAPKAVVAKGVEAKGVELALFAGAAFDGRYANNGWLMELPDPMTRVCWENPLIISPKLAAEWKVGNDDVVKIKGAPADLEAVIFVLPGHPEGVASIAVGYGRKNFGSVANGIGSNAYSLMRSGSMFAGDLTIDRTDIADKQRFQACVQDHHTIDAVGKKRLDHLVPELIVEGTLADYKKHPALGTRKIAALSMFKEREYKMGENMAMAKWGMAIDLTTCTGCSACVVACQAENNVPVVGRQMVYRGREMHWLRIDRYFKFATDKDGHHVGDKANGTTLGTGVDSKDVQVVHQPILCMHCENAPCEEVCPVAATTHSHEGLNMMTYNRCIGTRYCSNNCPYKVRRFNFFDYNSGKTYGTDENLYTPNIIRKDISELFKMQKNPQVSIRNRGVMEKCTYCVQRIEGARIALRAKNRSEADHAKFPDGSVQTACQQACPTNAIVFGDLNQPDSQVAKLHALSQSYGLLDPELNTKPRTLYLAKVRNNTNGFDEPLYNDHTKTKGWFFEDADAHGEGHGTPVQTTTQPASGGH
jgi:MoCo/4Fe-4S cofactor protein with predicted Tat translocation signal